MRSILWKDTIPEIPGMGAILGQYAAAMKIFRFRSRGIAMANLSSKLSQPRNTDSLEETVIHIYRKGRTTTD